MLIIAGTKVTRRKLGQVADYCSVCRDIRAFDLVDVGKVPHLYYVPLGRREIAGHEMRCRGCREVFPAEPDRYRTISRLVEDDVARLIEETNPDVELAMLERLESEERAAAGEASPEERARLLFDPFIGINPSIENRAAAVHLDRRSALWLAALLLLPGLLFAPAFTVNTSPLHDILLYSAIAVTGGLFIGLIHSFATDARRFVHRRHGRLLVEALLPLEPTREEFHNIVAHLRTRGYRVGRVVDPDWLYDAMMKETGR